MTGVLIWIAFVLQIIIIVSGVIVLLGAITLIVANVFTWIPYVGTPYPVIERILRELEIKKTDRIIDLGAGDGRVLEMVERTYGASGIGYELSPVPWLFAQWRLRRKKFHSRVVYKNFLKVDISEGDVIFFFLTKTVIKQLKEKFSRELKKGTIIISYGTPIPDWRPYKVLPAQPDKRQLCDVYIYEK